VGGSRGVTDIKAVLRTAQRRVRTDVGQLRHQGGEALGALPAPGQGAQRYTTSMRHADSFSWILSQG
jgi:hypothetical protein